MMMYDNVCRNVNGVWKESVVDQTREDLDKFSEMRKEKEKEKAKVGED